MGALKETVETKDAEVKGTTTIKKMTKHGKAVTKDKVVSMKVNSDMWERFKAITGKYGMTANGTLNQLMSDYVMREEKKLKDLEAI